MKMTTINRRAKVSLKKESMRSPTDLEFTHDFIRDVANRFTDPQTVSNMSKVSKKFNKALDLSDDKNKARFLSEYNQKVNREFPKVYRFLPTNRDLTATYKAYPNGRREGLYKEIDANGNTIVEGTYINGKLEGILTVFDRTTDLYETTQYFYQNNELKSLTHYDYNGIRTVRYYVTTKEIPFFYKHLRTFEDFMNSKYVYSYSFENFETNPDAPFSIMQKFIGSTSVIKIENEAIKLFEKYKKINGVDEIHETRYKNSRLLFDKLEKYNTEEKTVSINCQGKFIKITKLPLKGKSPACEEFFENGEKIGELNYFMYSSYLSRHNLLSDDKKSFYRGKEIHDCWSIPLRDKYDFGLRVLYKDGSREIITLEHNL